MSTRNKKQFQRCIYCGVLGSVTLDHVPPKCLLPAGARQNLVTVPSCEKCNGGFSKDDEYFRTHLCTRADLKGDPRLVSLHAATQRQLVRPEAVRFRHKLFQSWKVREVTTHSGLYLGNAWTATVDTKRLLRVVNRTMRGLYYIAMGEPIPVTHELSCGQMDDRKNLSAGDAATLNELLDIVLRQGKNDARGDGAFKWHYQNAEDDPHSSFWLLIFYDKLVFRGIVSPKLN